MRYNLRERAERFRCSAVPFMYPSNKDIYGRMRRNGGLQKDLGKIRQPSEKEMRISSAAANK